MDRAKAPVHWSRYGLPLDSHQSQAMGAICAKVETQGESRKEVEEDLRIDNRKRNSLIFAAVSYTHLTLPTTPYV